MATPTSNRRSRRYFTSVDDWPAKFRTQLGKMPRNRVAAAEMSSAARRPGVERLDFDCGRAHGACFVVAGKLQSIIER